MTIQISRTAKTGRYLNAVAWCMTFTGVFGFVFFGIAALGGSKWLASDFEWPAAISTGVVYVDGEYYVPHPSSRIQVYDEDWSFLRSFYVPSDGGIFAISKGVGQNITVHTARGQYVRQYARDGQLLKQRRYAYDYPDSGVLLVVPTPWYLWPFSHPYGFWLIAMIGILLHVALDKIRR